MVITLDIWDVHTLTCGILAGWSTGIRTMFGNLRSQRAQGLPSCFYKDVRIFRFLHSGIRYEDDFTAGNLESLVSYSIGTNNRLETRNVLFQILLSRTLYEDCREQRTFARLANSLIRGLALCSRLSSTRVSGLALSLRLSSFCKRSRLCDRLCAWTDGAMTSSLVR